VSTDTSTVSLLGRSIENGESVAYTQSLTTAKLLIYNCTLNTRTLFATHELFQYGHGRVENHFKANNIFKSSSATAEMAVRGV